MQPCDALVVVPGMCMKSVDQSTVTPLPKIFRSSNLNEKRKMFEVEGFFFEKGKHDKKWAQVILTKV